MTAARQDATKANAAPTKQFFVATLTRDIDLTDALLDLLDNCLDGALRQNRDPSRDVESARPYSGRYARLSLTNTEFTIEDNCGGIPKEVAIESAFRMGRPTDEVARDDSDIETVGMYGIGMKRAIFKLGSSASVLSTHPTGHFVVTIPERWISDSTDWTFPVTELQPEESSVTTSTTRIKVQQLHPQVAENFGDPNWVDDLRNRVSEHYSRIIEKGFTVYINSENAILPARERILYKESGFRPYFFKHRIRDVDIFLAVGINSPVVASRDSASRPASTTRSSRDGGWTVYCNDRAILVRDKTTLTGWGAELPTFHPQFSVVSGIVEFRGRNSEHLPVTTTKRGLDAQSEVWAITKRVMTDATKLFTSYTTAWKNERREKQDRFLRGSNALGIEALKAACARSGLTTYKRGALKGAMRFEPDLASYKPSSKKKTTRRIVFERERAEIRRVAEALFDDPDTSPTDVGNRCFQNVLEEL